MSDLPGIVITGASGRMGRMLVRTVADSPRARLLGAVERPGHDWIGRDVGAAMGGADLGVDVTDDPIAAAVGDAITGQSGEQVFVYGFAEFVDEATDAAAAAGVAVDDLKVENFG